MGTFFVYAIKSAFCLALFYLPYTLLLRNEKLHNINRLVLCGILVASLLLPLVSWEWFDTHDSTSLSNMPGKSVISQINNMGATVPMKENPNSWPLLLTAIYFSGVIFLLIIRLWQFAQMNFFITHGCLWKERFNNGITLYCHARPTCAFSWMRQIVIYEEDLESPAGDAIFKHEKAHVLCRHSLDIILVLSTEILQWFNPFVWMLAEDLRCIHEYQADEYVLKHGINAKNYQLYLIKKAVGSRPQSIANGLNQSTLKKRIAMMCNKKTNKWAALKYMYLLPAGVIATTAFARPEISNRMDGQLEQLSAIKVTNFQETVETFTTGNLLKIPLSDGVNATKLPDNIAQNKLLTQQPTAQEEPVYKVTEVLPTFPGGEVEFYSFIGKNIKYPQSALDSALQGRCICQFIVEKDGSISNIKAIKHSLYNKDINSPGMQKAKQDIEKEAIRTLSLMPKWNPGKIKGKTVRCLYTVPITFRLQ